MARTSESLAHFARHIVLGASKQFAARDRHHDGVDSAARAAQQCRLFG